MFKQPPVVIDMATIW